MFSTRAGGAPPPIGKLTERRLATGAVESAVDGELDLSVGEQMQEAIERAGSG
jgi:hypothetical protein